MYYGQQRYVKRLKGEIIDENARNNMVQRRLSDGARRHLPVIRQGNMSSPNNMAPDEYMSSIPSNEMANRGHGMFIASKKDMARKNLMGYLYSRQPTISRSNSFIAGEKPTEPGLPTVKYTNTPKGFERQRTSLQEQRRPPSLDRKKSILCDEHSRRRSAGSGRPDSNKFSLPEIIRDIYSSAAKLDSPEMAEEEFRSSDGNSIDIGENVSSLTVPRYHKSIKLYPPNHRPITPGLIEKLNKMKVSTRNRTEQWLRQMPESQLRYQENRARGSHTEAPNRWIYTDNS